MFNIDFDKLINNNLDNFVRQPKFVNRLKCIVYEVKNLYTQFISFRDDRIIKAAGNGQVIWLEKILNDKWDNISRGIFISDPIPSPFYIWKKTEAVPSVYLYKKFAPGHNFTPGEYCIGSDNIIYISAFASIGKDPIHFPGFWAGIGEVQYLRKKQDFLTSINFIVNVPNAVVFDVSEMTALIKYFKEASKSFTIITY